MFCTGLRGFEKMRYCGHTLSHLMQIRHNMTKKTRFPIIRRELRDLGTLGALAASHYELEKQ